MTFTNFMARFAAQPQAALSALRASARAAGAEAAVKPLVGLNVTAHAGLVSNVLRNYPFEQIYKEVASSAGRRFNGNGEAFAHFFAQNPATALTEMRTYADLLGRSDLVAPIKGLNIAEDSAKLGAPALQNYPIQNIFKALSALRFEGNAQAFTKHFAQNPATALGEMRALAELQGRGELVAPLKGLVIGEDSAKLGAPALQNYPIEEIFGAVTKPE